MDSLIAAAARALSAGDALAALKHVALRDDPAALALRGIAMAQLGEFGRARELLRRASHGFGPHEPLSRARCDVAEAEVALAMRDFGHPVRALAAAATTLQARGDRVNATQARLILIRRFLLLGRLDEAAAAFEQLDLRGLPPLTCAVGSLARAEHALRALRVPQAQAALSLARVAAERAAVPALVAEVAQTQCALDEPAARRMLGGEVQALRLHEVAALIDSGAMVVDACRRGIRAGDTWLALARRPVLFTLACALAQAWPGDVDRDTLIAQAFRTRRPDETHRARLRVEMGRLRALMAGLAGVGATARGFVLQPADGRRVELLMPPVEGEQGAVLALLSDGASWSTSALALAVGASQRTVQRVLAELEGQGRVRSVGQARARRWLAPPLTGFTTILLLPAALPLG